MLKDFAQAKNSNQSILAPPTGEQLLSGVWVSVNSTSVAVGVEAVAVEAARAADVLVWTRQSVRLIALVCLVEAPKTRVSSTVQHGLAPLLSKAVVDRATAPATAKRNTTQCSQKVSCHVSQIRCADLGLPMSCADVDNPPTRESPAAKAVKTKIKLPDKVRVC